MDKRDQDSIWNRVGTQFITVVTTVVLVVTAIDSNMTKVTLT